MVGESADYLLPSRLPRHQPTKSAFPFAPLEHPFLVQEYLEVREGGPQLSLLEGEPPTDVTTENFELVDVEGLEH